MHVDQTFLIPVDKIFTFYCTKNQIKKIKVGCRVLVPFGKKNVEKIGFVYKINHSKNKEIVYKKIKSIIDKKPIIKKNQIE